jgi:hypothetical protein
MSRLIVARCGCGATYTEEQWGRLPFCGVTKLDEPPHLELRDCVCRSTIAVWRDDSGRLCDEDGIAFEDVLGALRLMEAIDGR